MNNMRSSKARATRITVFREGESGQNLVELAVILPVMVLLLAYAVDFGYFFIAASTITSAARTATQYSVIGYSTPAGSSVAAAGPLSSSSSVASAAIAELASLTASSTTSSVQVCTKSLGMTANIPNCSNYGVTGKAYTPVTDPEAPRFVLQRVDVTYTVQPPVKISIFGTSLLPNLQFHRQVSMRAMD